MMGRSLRLLFGLLLLGLGLAGLSLTPPVDSAPLAQATATPTATRTPTITPTATLPPLVPYGDGMAVQSFPEARINCTLDVAGVRGGGFECVSGTPVPPRPTPAPPVDLTANLAHYWRLDEASGTRADTVGGLDLTPHGNVTSVEGGTAAGFDGQIATYLGSTGTVGLGAHTSIVMAYRVKWAAAQQGGGNAAPVTMVIGPAPGYAQTPFEHWISNTAGFRGADFAANPTDFNWDPAGYAGYVASGSTFAADTWYHVVGRYDTTTKLSVWVNAGTPVEASPNDVADAGSYTLQIGGDAVFNALNGAMKDAGIWFDVDPDQAWLDALYNGGAGWGGP